MVLWQHECDVLARLPPLTVVAGLGYKVVRRSNISGWLPLATWFGIATKDRSGCGRFVSVESPLSRPSSWNEMDGLCCLVAGSSTDGAFATRFNLSDRTRDYLRAANDFDSSADVDAYKNA